MRSTEQPMSSRSSNGEISNRSKLGNSYHGKPPKPNTGSSGDGKRPYNQNITNNDPAVDDVYYKTNKKDNDKSVNLLNDRKLGSEVDTLNNLKLTYVNSSSPVNNAKLQDVDYNRGIESGSQATASTALYTKQYTALSEYKSMPSFAVSKHRFSL